MSAELRWRHRSQTEEDRARYGPACFENGERCMADCQPWPCDAERMRVERDAAIRRASETLERLRRAYERGADRDDLVRLIDAALRSQESQKPPEPAQLRTARRFGRSVRGLPPETENR